MTADRVLQEGMVDRMDLEVIWGPNGRGLGYRGRGFGGVDRNTDTWV